MKNPFSRHFPEFELIQSIAIDTEESALLLGRGGAYAVCKVQWPLGTVSAPNYNAEEHGLLSGPLTRSCLAEVLQWTDRATATGRYRVLARLPENIHLFGNRGSPGG